MSQSKLSSAPQGPSSTERAVSPPDAVKSTVSPVTSRTGKRLPDEEFTSHDQEATVPVDAALTAEAQRDDEATAPVDAASATGEAPSAQESSAQAVETAAASPTNSNLSKLGLGALALVGLAAAVAGGGGDSKGAPQSPSQPSGDDGKPQVPSQPSEEDGKPQVPSQPSEEDGKPQVPSQPSEEDGKPQVPSQPSEEDGKPQVPSQPSGDDGKPQVPSQPSEEDGKPQVPSQPSGSDSKPPPVQVPGVGTKPINGQGVVTVSGVVDGAEWEFSLDDGDTWHKGDGNGVSASDLVEGPNAITIVQTDKDGNRSDAVVVVVIKDSIIEKPVLGTSTGTGAINDTGSISVGGIENNGKWEFSVDGGQTWRPGTGGSISGAELNEGDNTVIVKQTDEAGNVATAIIDVVKDSIIEKPVLGTSTGTGAINDAGSISVGGIENNGKWEFSVDGGQTWRPGTGGSISGAELNEGDNTVIVKQTDEAGNVATATIDVVKDSIIDKPVLGTSTGTGAINDTGSISVGGIENNGKWEFSVDGGQTWRPGTGGAISGAELNEGDNTVTVKQTDEAGNVATATIDVVKDSIIDKPVLGTSTGTGAINDTGSISVGGIENNGKWEFSVDGGQTWKPGTGGSISGAELNEGDNTVTVKQTDEAGNVATATIDVVKDSIIDKPVLGTSTGTGAINDAGSISVGGIENNGKWEFSVDGGQTWRPGTGGAISGAELNEGDNTVTVKQTDEAGNVATATIDVVKDSLIEKPVLGTSTGTGAINDAGSINVGGIENNGKWEFSVDGGQTWRPGTGGAISGAELKEGDNTVTVKQTDAAGNVATATITVVKDTLIDKPIVGTSTGTGSINNTGSVTVSGIESNGKWEFSTDGGQTWRPGTGGAISGAELNEGDNTVTVKQTDAAGNVATATITVVKDTLIDKPIVGTSTGTGSINNTGSVTVSGIENNGKWEFSTDGGQTWKPGTGNAISGVELKEGDNTVTVKQTDAAGNVATATITVVKDTLIDKPIVGTSTGTGSINNTGSVTVSGIENNGKWEFSTDGGQTWKPGTGNAIYGAELNEGDNTVIVKQTDAAGNEAINAITVSKDLKVDEPTVTTSTGGAINDAGWVNVGQIESGATWAYSLDNGKTWTEGTEPKIPGSVLSEGDNTLIIRQTDLAGNSASSTVLVVKDLVAAAPTLSLATDSGAVGDGLTNSGVLTVSGIESGARWEYSIDGADWQEGSGRSIADPGYANASHTVRVRQTDLAGNTSATASLTFTIDKLAPSVPVVSLELDSGEPGDLYTSASTLLLSGLEVGGAVFIETEGKRWSSHDLASSSISYWLPAFSSDGPKSVLIRQADKAGNQSTTRSFFFTLDTKAPDPVALSLATDSGAVGDRLTNSGVLDVSGIEAGARWEYSIDGANWQEGTGRTIADPGYANATHTVRVRQTDIAGNQSAESTFTFTIDKAAPVTPQVSLRYDGGSAGNPLTNSPDLKLSGLEVGSKIHVFKEGQWYVFEAHADTGFFHLPGFASDGPKTVLVKQVDAAGNESATASFDFTLDTKAPDAVDLSLVNDTGVAGDGRTSDATIKLSGLESDATWRYSLDGGITWTTGAGQVIAGSALNEGANMVTVAQIDRAGNQGASSSITVHKDTLVVAPTIKMPAAGSKAEFDASEEGFAYVVSASAADTSSMAALDALPPDQCHRVDVAAGGRVELSALSGLPDGYYRVVFSDKAGNLAAATTAGGMKHVQVQGGEILSTQVVMGTSGNDVLTAPNGGGAMISGDGFDTFVFSSGIKGVFDVDLHAIDTLDLRSLGLDKDRFFLEREQRFQRGTHQGKAAILIDWEATGDFTNPDVVLVSATASNPSVLYDDNGTGRMFPF